MSDLLSPFVEDYNAIKVVVFLETKLHSDQFKQIALTQDLYYKMLKTLREGMLVVPEDPDTFQVICDEKHSYTFPNIRDSYSEQELNDLTEDDEDDVEEL